MKGKRIAIGRGVVALFLVVLTTCTGRDHICFRLLFEPLGKKVQGYPEYRHRETGIVMVKLPGSTFWMGAQAMDPNGRNYGPAAEDDEGPVHELILSPFLIAKYEVTQREWQKVMESNPSRFTGDEDRSVENVSWDEIQKFEAKTGLALHSVAQWEYACRAGTTGPYAGTGNHNTLFSRLQRLMHTMVFPCEGDSLRSNSGAPAFWFDRNLMLDPDYNSSIL